MQFTSALLLSLAAIASAAPLAQRDEPTGFTLISARSASPVHLQSIVARGLHFWVGGETSTYCPGEQVDCSAFKNITVFAGQEGNPTSLSLSTNVPGGQLIYIAPGGAISFTQAHSSAYPEGSVVSGFNYYEDTNNKYVTPVANGSTGFLACPATADQKETGPWQVYADVEGVQVPSGCVDDCYGIGAVGAAASGPGAWQYA